MRRIDCTPRSDWQQRVSQLGLVWHSRPDGSAYWDERAAWAFTPDEVAVLETATAELYRLYLAAGQHVIDADRLGELGIPSFCHAAIRAAWDGEPRALNLGRFDLGWDGSGPPKLFEFNADTPTSLLEAAVVQWDWKQAVFPAADQFNSLHEALVARWREIAPPPGTSRLYLAAAADASGEDEVTIAYHADCAAEAGIATSLIAMGDIGWDRDIRRFVDLDGRAMGAICKLYPWEWLVHEPFGRQVIDSLSTTLWMEPIWKMLWSNKAMLAVLWELFPGHPNLLETRRRPLAGAQVEKPILGREGANVRIIGAEGGAASDGLYGAEGFVYQALYPLPGRDDQRPVIGSWTVDGAPVGIGIREDGPITGNLARFVPHLILEQ
ncbi:glutathionylspermidine synthase [Sphingomonas sp. IBVSS1]|nr:glutathionylspermidine synthase [Sphingomonas sp. IBVSS1]